MYLWRKDNTTTTANRLSPPLPFLSPSHLSSHFPPLLPLFWSARHRLPLSLSWATARCLLPLLIHFFCYLSCSFHFIAYYLYFSLYLVGVECNFVMKLLIGYDALWCKLVWIMCLFVLPWYGNNCPCVVIKSGFFSG